MENIYKIKLVARRRNKKDVENIEFIANIEVDDDLEFDKILEEFAVVEITRIEMKNKTNRKTS